MKTIPIILSFLILHTAAMAGSTAYVRDTTKPGAITTGLVKGVNTVAVTVEIYGSNDLLEAQRYGQYLAGIGINIPEAAARARKWASEKYSGKPQMQQWALHDIAAEFDRLKASK